MKTAIQIWRHQKTNYQHLGQKGVVVTKTRIIEAPLDFKGPYWVVLVAIDKKTKAVGQWADSAEPKVGMKVTAILRRIGEADRSGVIEYGVKWIQSR